MLVPARRDVGEDSDGDNLEQQHQGIGEAAHAPTRTSAGGCAPVLCAGGIGESVCVGLDCPLPLCGAYPIVSVLICKSLPKSYPLICSFVWLQRCTVAGSK